MRVVGTEEAIQAVDAQVRYLPPYSPDYNPVEQVFAKLKILLSKVGTRTVEELWSAISHLLGQFSADECERYIRHAGYGRSA